MTQPQTEQAETEAPAHPPIEYVVREQPQRKRSPLRRLGCGLLLAVWFAVLLVPLAFFVLAIQGDITIGRGGDIPSPEQYPRLQVWLVNEIDFRGLGILTTDISRPDEEDLCIQSDVRYLLWQGSGEPATFCDCYTRSTVDDDWTLQETVQGPCS
jgi:hypothetical protein